MIWPMLWGVSYDEATPNLNLNSFVILKYFIMHNNIVLISVNSALLRKAGLRFFGRCFYLT